MGGIMSVPFSTATGGDVVVGDHRLRHQGDAAQRRVEQVDELAGGFRRAAGIGVEDRKIAAGAEHAAGAREHQRAHGRIAGQGRHGGGELGLQLIAQRIARLGAVQGQRGNAIGDLDVELGHGRARSGR